MLEPTWQEVLQVLIQQEMFGISPEANYETDIYFWSCAECCRDWINSPSLLRLVNRGQDSVLATHTPVCPQHQPVLTIIKRHGNT